MDTDGHGFDSRLRLWVHQASTTRYQLEECHEGGSKKADKWELLKATAPAGVPTTVPGLAKVEQDAATGAGGLTHHPNEHGPTRRSRDTSGEGIAGKGDDRES